MRKGRNGKALDSAPTPGLCAAATRTGRCSVELGLWRCHSYPALVTVSTSPSRIKTRHPASFIRLAVLRNLFAEDAFGARRGQVAFLRRQPGGPRWMSALSRRSCTCAALVSVLHC